MMKKHSGRFIKNNGNTVAVFSGDIFTLEDIESGKMEKITMSDPIITFTPDGNIKIEDKTKVGK